MGYVPHSASTRAIHAPLYLSLLFSTTDSTARDRLREKRLQFKTLKRICPTQPGVHQTSVTGCGVWGGNGTVIYNRTLTL